MIPYTKKTPNNKKRRHDGTPSPDHSNNRPTASELLKILEAHHLFSRKAAEDDVILVLEHGRVTERGTYEQLLTQKGTYYHLYTGTTELS